MALIKCPKCGYMNAISFDKCSNCKQSLNFTDDTPPQNTVSPIKKPIVKERIKTTDRKSRKANNKLKEASEKLQKTSNKLNEAGNNIQKVGMGCCGTVVWVFIFLVVVGSCSSAIKNKKISSSSSESLKAETENSKPSEETPIKTEEPQLIQQTEVEAIEPSEEFKPIDPLDNFTTSQKNAILQAQSYLEFTPFSRSGLIEQLSSEYGNGYDIEDAIFAVEYLESENKVDWNEQAIKQANSYLESSPFSRLGLIDQLSSEYGSGYTIEEAENAIIYLEENHFVDWYEQAVRQAECYLESFAFSKQELIDQLSSEYGSQFTIDEAEYGANIAYVE